MDLDSRRVASSTLFDDMFDAVSAYLLRGTGPPAPLGLVAHLTSWESPQPRLDVWRCPANPEAKGMTCDGGGDPSPGRPVGMCISSVWLRGTNDVPCVYYNNTQNFPLTWPIPAEITRVYHGQDTDVAPQKWLAEQWPLIRDTPEVSLLVEFHVKWLLDDYPNKTYWNQAWVTLLTRFSAEAQGLGYRNLNAHLLDNLVDSN